MTGTRRVVALVSATASLATVAVLVALLACSPGKAAREDPPASVDSGATRVASTGGFQTPESVTYDARQDVYFVSNINGAGTAKDRNGFISRMRPDGSVDSLRFIAGGRGGVRLDAPKGVALAGDTLWVTDIDALRAFDARTGAPLASVDLAPSGAVFLNDVSTGPDGALYITDTGIRFDAAGRVSHPGPDRIFRVTPGGRVSVALQDSVLAWPNGIVWDAARRRFVVVPLDGKTILSWTPGAAAPTAIASGAGGFDGVEIMPDGRIVVSSQEDSSVWIYDGEVGRRAVRGLANLADIGLDTRRRRVAAPLLVANRVEIWQL